MENNINILQHPHHQQMDHSHVNHINEDEVDNSIDQSNIFWDKTINVPSDYTGFSSTIGIPITPSVILSDCFYDYAKLPSTQRKFNTLNLNILAREIRSETNSEVVETEFHKYCKPIIEAFIGQELTPLRLKYRLETLQKYVRFNTMISWMSTGRTDLNPSKLFPKRLRKIFEDGDENGNPFTASQMLALVEEHNKKGKDYRTFKKRINNQDLIRLEEAMDDFALRSEAVNASLENNDEHNNGNNTQSTRNNNNTQYINQTLNQPINNGSNLFNYSTQPANAIRHSNPAPVTATPLRRPLEPLPTQSFEPVRKRQQVVPVEVDNFFKGLNTAIKTISNLTQPEISKEYKITEILTMLLKRNLINTTTYGWISQELIEFGEFPTGYSITPKFIDGLVAVYDVCSNLGTLQDNATVELFMLHLRRKFGGII